MKWKVIVLTIMAAVLVIANVGCRQYTLPNPPESQVTTLLGTAVTYPAGTITIPSSTEETGETFPGSGTGTALSDVTSSSGTTQTETTVQTGQPTTNTETTVPTQPEDPEAGGELRGVWLSYIELNSLLNGKTVEQAKSVLDEIMENCAAYHLNAVFFHVRANSDAYYISNIFSPAASVKNLISQGFDPLAYAVAAAHSRGLELHAWVNPYRIGTKLEYKVAGIDDYFQVGDRYYYTPSSIQVQNLVLDGLRELTRNYAIDGIQYDDYFYPDSDMIPASSPAEFERADYEAYTAAGGSLSVDNWRRSHVDSLITASYTVAHSRAGCVFGVSPSHNYLKTYSRMYADTAKWLAVAGYVDYLCPQIYFGFHHESSAFDQTLNQWLGYKKSSKVNLYVGLGLYKVGISPDQYAGETGKNEWAESGDLMKRSVEYARGQQVPGLLFYSYSFFDETTSRSLSSGQSYDSEIARREVENLLAVLG